MNKTATALLDFLKERDAMDQLPEIVDSLQKELYRTQAVSIISAKELPTADLKKLKELATKKWGEHEFAVSVDPSLLSGHILRFGHTVIDTSGRAGLADLSASLS